MKKTKKNKKPIKIPLQLVTNTDKIHQYSQRNNKDVYQFSTMYFKRSIPGLIISVLIIHFHLSQHLSNLGTIRIYYYYTEA